MTGTGRADVAAYGIADAEMTLEKELSRAWPGATLRIPEVHRTEAVRRIVESFELLYHLTLEVEVDAPDAESARRAARAAARQALRETRFARVVWND